MGPALNFLRAIAACLALSGCAAFSQPPYWVKTWEGALTVNVNYIDIPPWQSERVAGWTVCDKPRRHCEVLVMRDAENRDCVVAHEYKHTAGYDHPADRYNLSCSFMRLGP